MDHFWFLWALMFLYLLSPMLRKLFTGDKERNMTTIVFLLLMAICFCVNVSMGVNCLQPFETNVPQSLRIWSHLGYYWLGACLYRIVKSEDALRVGILSNKKLLVAMTVILWISMAFIQYGLCRIVMGITSPEYIFDSPAIILTNISIFICCIVMKENIVVSRGARLIQYSLGIYILHPFVIRVLEKILPWINMGWPLRWLILFVASMFTTAIMLKIPVLNKLIKL